MKPLEILVSFPKWSGASAEAILTSPAWTMPCRLGESSCTMRLDAVHPAETLDLSILLENENHVLGIADSPNFPELHAVWNSRKDVPEPILLALVEKDCGKLFQLLENATRRQLKVAGLAAGSGTGSEMAYAQIYDSENAPLFSFTLDITPSLSASLGQIRNLDMAHASIREEVFPAEVEYASFAIPAADLTSLAPGDALLLPEIETMRPRLIVMNRLAVSENGVAPWKDEGVLRICAAENRSIDMGSLLDAVDGDASGMLPQTPPDNAPLKLVRSGKTLVTGRLGRLGSQFAFLP